MSLPVAALSIDALLTPGCFILYTASAFIGCHVDAPCEPSLPRGAHLNVEVLEVVRAATSPECDKIGIMAGDEFGITIGVPFEGGAYGDCLSASGDGPPEFSTSLNIGTCRPGGALGTRCDVLRSDCDFPAGLEVYLLGREDFDVGTAREMTYHISFHHALATCARISCSNEYRVQVTRLD